MGTERRWRVDTVAAATAGGVALLAAIAILVMRAVNDGMEPVGRNWWLAVEVALGIGFLPAGVFLCFRRRRRVLGACFVVIGATQIAAAVATQAEAFAHVTDDGTSVAWAATEVIEGFGLVVLVAIVPLLLPWHSYRRTKDPLTLWLALGVVASWLGALCAVTPVGDLPGADVLGPLLLLATVPLVALGAVIDALRGDTGAFGVASHRFLVWAVLAAAIVLAYTAVVSGFGALLGSDGPAWLLVACTAGIALAVEPARRRIRRLVDGVVYGDRDDPLALVREVMQQVTTADIDHLLPSLAETLGRSMRFDYVTITGPAEAGAVRLATYGSPTVHGDVFPLANGVDAVGRLVLGCRDGGSLRPKDRAALDDIVPHVSLAVSFVALTADLRRSSLAVVTTREEERRRLRRDLHDGLGPSLTGIALGLRTVLGRLRRAHVESSTIELIDRLAHALDTSTIEVKRIVRDLRPTALDDQGLAGALAEFVRSLDAVLRIELLLPTPPLALPAAVEIATYRIATEALTNVVRHAAATTCRLCLDVDDHVDIDIVDDGVGLSADHVVGVGLTAMRERVAELGGTLAVTDVVPHGTRVHARLPVEIA